MSYRQASNQAGANSDCFTEFALVWLGTWPSLAVFLRKPIFKGGELRNLKTIILAQMIILNNMGFYPSHAIYCIMHMTLTGRHAISAARYDIDCTISISTRRHSSLTGRHSILTRRHSHQLEDITLTRRHSTLTRRQSH